MKNIKTSYFIALIAIFLHQSSTLAREKRSFSWPSFLGGSGSANTEENNEEPVAEASAQEIEVTPQQQFEIPIQQLSSGGYHYPVWRVHKYNGIHLKPLPISLVEQNQQQQQGQQQPIQLTQSQLHQFLLQQQPESQSSLSGNFPIGNIVHQPIGQQFASPIGQQFASPIGQQFATPNGQQFALPNGQQFTSPNGQQFVLPSGQQFASINGQQFASTNGQQFTSPNGQQFTSPNVQQLASQNGLNVPKTGSTSPSKSIPPELQELADQLGIKDASKLPSLEEAMGLLGTTSRAETIQTIKELAATKEGMDLVRQFLASEPGATENEEENSNNNGGDITENVIPPQPFIPQQQVTGNPQRLPIGFLGSNFPSIPGSIIPIPHQRYGVPSPYPPKQHSIYGLPNVNQANIFHQGYYPPRSNIMKIVKNEASVPHREYNVPNEDSNSGHEVQAPHEKYGVPNELSMAQAEHKEYNTPKPEIIESQQSEQTVPQHQYPPKQHEIYGLPDVHQEVAFQQNVPEAPLQGYYAPRSNFMDSAKSEAIVPHQEYNVPNEDSKSDHQTQVPHEDYGVPQAEHQEYNTPKPDITESQQSEQTVPQHQYPPKQHEIYGLPNVHQETAFQQNVPEAPPLVPHQEYNVPHEDYGVPQAEHEEYNTPKPDITESQRSEQTAPQYPPTQYELYGPPNVNQAVAFQQEVPQQEYYAPHQEYNEPNEDSKSDHQTHVPHEVYGIPNQGSAAEENLGFSQPQQVYSIPDQSVEEHETASNEYGPPQAENNLGSSISHQTYGVPYQEDDSSNSHVNQLNEQDIFVPRSSIPSGLHTDASKDSGQINHSQQIYSLPHQQFFPQSPNVFRQPHSQLQPIDDSDSQRQYGPRTTNNGRNMLTQIPIIRQIDGGLDRTNTNLELAQLLTTTVRPDAGFLERITSWTKYFAPPAPTIPIVPPKVDEHSSDPEDTNSDDDLEQENLIPIPQMPQLDEPHLEGLPIAPQLPNIHIPKKFIMPPSSNQGPFIRIQNPSSSFDSLTNNGHFTGPSTYGLPEPFDGQSVEQFVPDISQLPLDHSFQNSPQILTSYGTPILPYSYSNDDSSPAASEQDEQHIAVVLPEQTVKDGNRFDDDDSVDNEIKVEELRKYNGPQRISSYDSYATGKLNRADDDAIIQLIPTQKPLYSNRGRQLGKLEESSVIDAIATMTSGFRPIS